MTVFVCVDDNFGLRFNGRRQSKDRILISDLINSLDGKLYAQQYSIKLFEHHDVKPEVAESAFEVPSDGCFLAELPMAEHLEKIDKLVIYKWNRVYPADLYFDIRPENAGFKLISTQEFEGYSHDLITKEVYVK